MSHEGRPRPVTVNDLRKAKLQKRKISMVTCYDAAFARLVDASQIDCVLVGDSLGNVMMGHESTLQVTMDDMVHHSKCVAAGLSRAFLCTDMPFGSYQVSVAESVANAVRLVGEGRAHAVKLEGGSEICPQIEAITKAGIPVIAHLGLTPQSIHRLGGYRVQGRDQDARSRLISDARSVVEAGAEILVLELLPQDVAREISASVEVPTIGIGAGRDCDGQVLVLQDLLGFDDEFSPKFLKNYLSLGVLVKDALNKYDTEVKEGVFPGVEHSY